MILYDKNTTDFFNLGLGPITTAIKATVTEERNGSFYLEATVLIDDVVYPKIQEDNIIKADASKTLKDQRFRIKRVVDKHDGTAEIYAEHVSYLTAELPMKPEVTVNGSANQALTAWKGALIGDNPFVVDSDILTTNSTSWRIDKVENPRQALGGVEGSILDVWGGEYRFDNYHISLLKKRGKTANTVLAYGRNITDFEQERNIENTYTSIFPYAIYTDDKEKEHLVTIDGYTVDSEYVGNYPNPRVKPVDFSSEFDHEETPTKARLKKLAESYVKDNEIGVPKVSIRVSFLDLSQSPDYAEFKHLEEVSLCDDVKVIYPKLGVDTVAKVIRTVWNVLSDSYDEIEIGEKRVTLASQINDTAKEVKEINNQIVAILPAANGKNTIFYGLFGENGLGEPTAIRVGDMWYKPVGENTEFYIWDGTIWKLIMSTAPDQELLDKIDEAIQRAKDAEKAGDDAQEAGRRAENAANVANQESQKATQKANDAFNAASDAVKLVDTAVASVEEAKSDAKNARENALKALQDVEGLSGRVTKAETSISKNTEAITFKAAKTDLDATNKRVTSTESSLSVQSESIKLLNTKTDGLNTTIGSLTSKYDSLNSTIIEFKGDTTEKFTTVNQTLTSIQSTVKDKANQSQVTQLSDLLNTTVSTVDGHTSSITQMAKDINLRVEKDKIINQINISTEGILIDGDNIWITGKTKIDNAVIGSGQIKDLAVTNGKLANLAVDNGKIKDLSASKLTSGTIDAKVINVLNLNASNMTTGTLNGANVNVINLNAASITSGTLNASLVRLMAQNGKKTVEITGSGFSTTDNNGKLRMTIGVRDLAGDGQSDPSNVVFYSGNGENSTYIGTNVEDTFSIVSASGNMRGFFSFPKGLIISSKQLRFNDPRYSNTYIEVRSTNGGKNEPILFPSKHAFGVMGHSSYWWRESYVVKMSSQYLNIGSRGAIAQLDNDSDSTGPFWRSWGIYDRTYSGNQSSVVITSNGVLGRVTSARKYKTDIQPLSLSRGTTDKRILYMQPVSWQDKAEIQHHGVSRRYYGYIADDFHNAGLTEVVQYGTDGQVEGLSYDRLGIYTIPILREHEESLIKVNFALDEQSKRIETLEQEVQRLKQKLEEVA